jgi:hypothetical protein
MRNWVVLLLVSLLALLPHRMAENDELRLDYVRNLSFILYGGFYQGMGHTFLYSHLYPSLFGTEPIISSVLAQASMDNVLLAPFVCLPTVYIIKSLLQGTDVQAGLEKYWDHIFSQHALLKYWSLWFPVACFKFGLVPEHLRVPFAAFISFFWVCMLSTISAQKTARTTSSMLPPLPNTNDYEQVTGKSLLLPGRTAMSTVPVTSTQ